MKPLRELPALEAETFDLRNDHVKANDRHPNPGRSALRWLDLALRTIDAQRDDLERTHWKKIWRSMQAD